MPFDLTAPSGAFEGSIIPRQAPTRSPARGRARRQGLLSRAPAAARSPLAAAPSAVLPQAAAPAVQTPYWQQLQDAGNTTAAYVGPQTREQLRQTRMGQIAAQYRQAAPSEIMTAGDDMIPLPSAPGSLGQAYQSPWEAFNARSQLSRDTARAGSVPTTFAWQGPSGVEQPIGTWDALQRQAAAIGPSGDQARKAVARGGRLAQERQTRGTMPQWMRSEMRLARAQGRRIPSPTQLRLGQTIAPSAAAQAAGAPAATGGVDAGTQLMARGMALGADPNVLAAQQQGLAGVQRAAQLGRNQLAGIEAERQPVSDELADQQYINSAVAQGKTIQEAKADLERSRPALPGSVVGLIPPGVQPEIQGLVDRGAAPDADRPAIRREARAILENKTELSDAAIAYLLDARFGPEEEEQGVLAYGKRLLRGGFGGGSLSPTLSRAFGPR